MDNPRPRPPAGVFVSLLTSIGLLTLFFMPWLKVSCNPEAATNAAGFRGMQDVPEEFTKPTVMARASGWDLARGRLVPEQRFSEQASAAAENQKGPPAKPWAWAGLILPVLLAGLSLLCLSGKVSFGGTAKWMLLLALGGVALMLVAASVDYIDTAMDQARDEIAAKGAPAGSAAFQRDMEAAAAQARQLIQTKTTPYLWVSLGLYALIGGCGLFGLGAAGIAPASESDDWRNQGQAAADYLGPAVAVPDGDPRAPSGPYDPAPPGAPRQAPAPFLGEKASSRT